MLLQLLQATLPLFHGLCWSCSPCSCVSSSSLCSWPTGPPKRNAPPHGRVTLPPQHWPGAVVPLSPPASQLLKQPLPILLAPATAHPARGAPEWFGVGFWVNPCPVPPLPAAPAHELPIPRLAVLSWPCHKTIAAALVLLLQGEPAGPARMERLTWLTLVQHAVLSHSYL